MEKVFSKLLIFKSCGADRIHSVYSEISSQSEIYWISNTKVFITGFQRDLWRPLSPTSLLKSRREQLLTLRSAVVLFSYILKPPKDGDFSFPAQLDAVLNCKVFPLSKKFFLVPTLKFPNYNLWLLTTILIATTRKT